MSLRDELKSLKRQQREEMRNLRFSYARTKREYARALSPDRLLRKHMGASLGAAAIAGFLLAPKPGRKDRPSASPLAALGGLSGLVARFMPGKKKNQQPPQQQEKPQPKPGLASTLLAQALGMIMARVNWQDLLKNYVAQMMGKMPGANGHANGNGHEPTMMVGDAGSLRN